MKKLQTTIFRYTSRWGEAGMEFSEHFCPPLPHTPRTQCVHFLRLKQKTQDPNQPWSLGKISDCHFFWSSLMVCFYLCFSWTFVGQYLLLGGQKTCLRPLDRSCNFLFEAETGSFTLFLKYAAKIPEGCHTYKFEVCDRVSRLSLSSFPTEVASYHSYADRFLTR